jgi:hypothetical protein
LMGLQQPPKLPGACFFGGEAAKTPDMERFGAPPQGLQTRLKVHQGSNIPIMDGSEFATR